MEGLIVLGFALIVLGVIILHDGDKREELSLIHI